MKTVDFLRAVLPEAGWYFIATPAEGYGYIHKAFTIVEDAAEEAEQLAKNNKHAFFALARFAASQYTDVDHNGEEKIRRRTKDNAVSCRSLWLDIDCGEGKSYPSQIKALTDIVELIKNKKLPRPSYTVSSGNGLHIYWVLDTEIPKKQWITLAQAFKRVAIALQIKADHKVTGNIAGVLRPVGTLNVKDPANPKPVAVVDRLSTKIAYPVKAMISWLARSHEQLGIKKEQPQVEIDYSLPWCSGLEASYAPSYAVDMANKCQLFAEMRDTQGATYEYNLWLDALRVLISTEEGKEEGHPLIHEWMCGHPTYTYDAVEAKIESIKDHRATTCSLLSEGYEKCKECAFYGKIRSPIVLGTRMPEIRHEAVVIDSETGEKIDEVGELPPEMQDEYRWTSGRQLEAIQVKEGKTGQVTYWRRICASFPKIDFLWVNDEGQTVARVSNRIDVNRIQHGDIGASIIAGGGTKLIQELGHYSVMPDYPTKELERYMRTWVEHALKTSDFQNLRKHMGWQSDGSFMMGNRLYYPDGRITTAVVSRSLANYINAHEIRGDLQSYIGSIDRLYNRPLRTAHQMMWMAAFASPLLAVYDDSPIGIVISAVSAKSGTGKTSAAQAAISVWGNPYASGQSTNSTNTTELALTTMAGQRKHFPVLVDETTSWNPQRTSEFVYNYSFGTAKLQAKAEGGLRDNAYLNWQNMLFLTANTQASSALIAQLGNAGPRIARLFEIDFPNLDLLRDDPHGMEILKEMLRSHSGVAGDAYIKQLVKIPKETIRKAIQTSINYLAREVGASSDARYWLLAGATILVAFEITAKIGLHRFDKVEFRQTVVNTILAMKGRVAESQRPFEDLLSALLAEFSPGLIVTETDKSDSLINIRSMLSPKSSIVGRVILKGKYAGIYLPVRSVRKWCQKEDTDFSAMAKHLQSGSPPILQHVNQRVNIGRGTMFTTGRTACWKLDLNQLRDQVQLIQRNNNVEKITDEDVDVAALTY